MMKTYRFWVLSALFVLAFSGCRPVYSLLLGIDMKPEWKQEHEIVRDFEKHKIPAQQRYVLDTASYREMVLSKFRHQRDSLIAISIAEDSPVAKRMLTIAKANTQPAQIRYFDAQGTPIFKLVNCYIDPPIPINWNVEGCFDQFPPKIDVEILNSGNKRLQALLPHIRTLSGDAVAFPDLPEADYYAVVFWNDFFRRPSRKLIKTLKKYDAAHAGQETYFLFVNNHNEQIWAHVPPDQKREYLKEVEEWKAK